MNAPAINNNTAITASTSGSTTTASGSINNNNTTRVYLRVKRRRCPSPTHTSSLSSCNDNIHINNCSNNNKKGPNTDNSVSGGPDRIQIALPYISTTTTTTNTKNNKRRKISDKEERALIDRLDSAVSLHDTTTTNTTNNNATVSLFNTPARSRSLNAAGSHRGNINNPYDPIITQHSHCDNEMQQQQQQRDRSASFASNSNNANTSNEKETPAPPIKPKRTITFRKIHNLQKRLLLDTNHNNSSSTFATTGEGQKIRIVDVKEQSDEGSDDSDNDDEKINIDNTNMADDDDSDDNDKVSEKASTPKTDNTIMMGQPISNIPSIAIIKGSGQRINRMRSRASSEEEEEKKCDDNNEDEDENGGDQGEGGRRHKKRRKVSKWIVEQSRTVLESDFIKEEGDSSMNNNNGSFLFGGGFNNNTNCNNTATNHNNNNSHHNLPPETIRLIEYSLKAMHVQNGGSVTPHLAFLQFDPRLCGMGYLYVDYALGSFVEVDGGASTGCTNGGMDFESDIHDDTSNRDMNDTSDGDTHVNNDGKGRTILHMAALYGDISNVRTLLNEMNATPNILDGNGNTPSMLARAGLDRLSLSPGDDMDNINQAELLARRGTYNVIEALIEGKVQSIMMTQNNTENNNNNNSSSMAATTTTTTTKVHSMTTASLDIETIRLIETSLTSLLQQQQNNDNSDSGGSGSGSVSSHISFIKNDPRLNDKNQSLVVNHALSQQGENKGRTALHLAALYGDFIGVRTLLTMGSNPTLKDGLGNTPAMLGRYMAVVDLLVEGEKKWRKKEEGVKMMHDDTKPISGSKDGNDNDEEYYYEVYCLEETTAMNEEGNMKSDAKSSSNFLRPKDTTAAGTSINTDSIPGLELSSVLSEDDTATYSSGGMNRQQQSQSQQQCALIELQQGFGYWNERGELILEADSSNRHQSGGDKGDEDDERFVQKFYHNNGGDGDDDSMMAGNGGEDEHDSNDEGYDGNDYPDDDISFGSLGDPNDSDYEDYRDADAAYGRYGDNNSDDDDESLNNNLRLDFRNRYVSKDALNQFDFDGEEGEEDETGY